MKLNSIEMVTANPSSFGMPACGGHAFGTTSTGSAGSATATDFGGASRVREAVTQADTGLAIAYVPGTSAWSPPTS